METEVLDIVKQKTQDVPFASGKSFRLNPRGRRILKVFTRILDRPISPRQLNKALSAKGVSAADVKKVLGYLTQSFNLESGPSKPDRARLKILGTTAKSSPESFDSSAAGKQLVRELQQVEGGAWTGQDLQEQFALTSATLHKRRKEHRILFWRNAKHVFHYPRWQFTPTGALLPGVQEVLQAFHSHDEWRLMRYFLSPRRQLAGSRPLDLLRTGKMEQVLKHAKAHAEENTW